jgi:hypothetical protein
MNFNGREFDVAARTSFSLHCIFGNKCNVLMSNTDNEVKAKTV